MAPTISATTATEAVGLVKRYYYGDYYYGNSRWYDWGRWVVVGACIFIFLIVLLSCTCLARRRRRRGVQPVYGTGWMAPTNGKYGVNQQQHEMNSYQQGYQPNQYQGQPGGYGYNQQQPQGGYYNSPPAYQGQQNTGTTFNPNDGYYGQQQYGVQQPANSYQRDGNFSPPAGPPPGK